jgi:hypothetical protein
MKMTEPRHDRSDTLAEQWLRANRPEPDPDFVRSLESRLFPPRRERAPHRRPRPLFAGAAAALAGAAAVLVLALAGVGPLGSSGSDSGQATTGCHYVTVNRKARVPVIVERKGNPTLEYRTKLVQQRVKRCQ